MLSKYSCVYKITTSCSNKVYIGSSVEFDKRVTSHINRLNSNTHPNRHLQAAWNKYGADTFTFECIEECDESNLIEREQFWIDYYDAANIQFGYNISPTAGSTLGRPLSEDTKNKIRAKALGRKASSETREKMSLSRSSENNPMYGKHHSDMSKDRMRYLKDGALRSIAQSGSANPFYGRKHTEETKKVISQKCSGQRRRSILTPEQVKEIKQSFCEDGRSTTLNDLFAKIAAKYGVSVSCIRKIYRGERWSDI